MLLLNINRKSCMRVQSAAQLYLYFNNLKGPIQGHECLYIGKVLN